MSAGTDAPLGAELLRDALGMKRDQGELAARDWLQQEAGLGAGDLDAAVQWLIERGEMVEVTPGEYRAVYEDEGGEPVSEPGGGEVDLKTPLDFEAARRIADASGETVGSLREFEARYGPRPARPAVAGLRESAAKRTVLTAAVAAALAPEVIGALVAAGIEEAVAAGVPYELVVEP